MKGARPRAERPETGLQLPGAGVQLRGAIQRRLLAGRDTACPTGLRAHRRGKGLRPVVQVYRCAGALVEAVVQAAGRQGQLGGTSGHPLRARRDRAHLGRARLRRCVRCGVACTCPTPSTFRLAVIGR
jgi:hypothetical protein